MPTANSYVAAHWFTKVRRRSIGRLQSKGGDTDQNERKIVIKSEGGKNELVKPRVIV